MENEAEKKPIEKKVLDAIQSGRVKMKPKWHFILRGALFATGAILVLLTVLYLCSFVIFILRRSGVIVAPSFGLRGWSEFFCCLPWLLILFIIIFLIILEILVKHYAFAYRRPLIYSAMGICLIALAGGVLLERSPLHNRLSEFADKDQLPFAGGFYRNIDHGPGRNIHRGEIVILNIDGFDMRSRRLEVYKVVIGKETIQPQGGQVQLGDMVVVFGHEDGHVIKAIGVRPVRK